MGVLWLILGIIVFLTRTEGIRARSNILLFLTDDQDVFLDGMEPLQKTKKLLAEKGITFSNAFATTPVCCPSRASLLTGKYPHNTETINNTVAGNCGGQYWRTNGEMNTFASILQKSGYETMYAGKYMNQYGTPEAGGIHQVPVGWSQWNGLQGNSRYYNYKLSINGVEESHGEDYETDYLTDVIGRKAEGFLNSWNKSSPFLMVLATPASHAPFTPAPQYKDNYANLTAPQIPSYNQQPGSSKHWFLRTEPQILSKSVRDSIDMVYRNRWRTLLSVDDLVSKTIHHLQDIGELANTYIIYTSDHGYHMGEFGLTIDKRQPYEFDIRVPLLIRGPNIPMNTTSNTPALLIDLAPTILDMAGIKPSDDMDGVSLIAR
ncbi:N-acetylglucosamine-6-sulfatase [Eurytemora carolleeae]|uniref:N-acetylglucosamine-6-sulfatase n=1 Tax=Eurytemora carolleeae TaxID=1294199 RepID=UPI000C772F16|nr:N-acetylglucosamine-6-sulfatase [Eurytemora carolleeae]|eukprot:XP_023339862.1 N-acetylglucosamine-6-sulfatase-like [Eurytemora affinis]